MRMPSSRAVLHLVAPAGSCRGMMAALRCRSASELIDLIRQMTGGAYRVSGNRALIEVDEDDDHGGRNDDARRAADLQRALADDHVAGIVALRGGAWLTRILPRIDFDVLRGRSTRVALFGFSELTTVINIASCYSKAVCWYDMGPAFIPAGLSRWAGNRDSAGDGQGPGPAAADAKRWARQQFPRYLADYFADVIARMEGRASPRQIGGRLVQGKLARDASVTIVGGTLSVMISLIGTPYARSIFRTGRWLAIEDVGEAPHRIDRMLAHLQLAGILERSGGLLIGDFHEAHHDRLGSVLASLERILPRRGRMPIVVSRDFGHIWPMAPLPIGRAARLHRSGPRSDGAAVDLIVPWEALGVRRGKWGQKVD
ncbi:MAG: LD-carboxypeptidase [Planctomycetota bacterium]